MEPRANLPYHTRRWRDTCIGAGHVHCEECDASIGIGRNERDDALILRGSNPYQCQKCYWKAHPEYVPAWAKQD